MIPAPQMPAMATSGDSLRVEVTALRRAGIYLVTDPKYQHYCERFDAQMGPVCIPQCAECREAERADLSDDELDEVFDRKSGKDG